MKQRLFIGSSSEALPLARALEELLARKHLVALWTNDVFRPGGYVVPDLRREISQSQFTAFIATADDMTRTRGKQHSTIRDNIAFEAGISVGILGMERTFVIVPTANRPRLPSDLLGVTTLEFGDFTTGNELRVLSPVATAIDRHMERVGVAAPGTS